MRPKNGCSGETEQGKKKHHQLPPVNLALRLILCDIHGIHPGKW
jgi:hypothetical protein